MSLAEIEFDSNTEVIEVLTLPEVTGVSELRLYTTDRTIAMDADINFVEKLSDLKDIAFSYIILDLEEIE